MPYDVAFRHQQALDPSALTTIVAALHAVTTAIDDCRNAGVPFDADPGVLLLARHLGHIAGAGSDDSLLRRRCEDKIAELKKHPALATLAIRGVSAGAPGGLIGPVSDPYKQGTSPWVGSACHGRR